MKVKRVYSSLSVKVKVPVVEPSGYITGTVRIETIEKDQERRLEHNNPKQALRELNKGLVDQINNKINIFRKGIVE